MSTSSENLSVPQMPYLGIQKHVAYHKRCLRLLPSAFQGNDLNRLSLGFFLLNSLDIFNRLDTATSPEERQNWTDWIYKCQLSNGGFRGSTATKTAEYSVYDTAHLPATYFAIASLLILGDDLKGLDREGALLELKKSQNKDGSFSPVLLGEERFGEVDVRHVYCATAVRAMLSPVEKEEDIDVSAAIRYIQQCKNYDGGYSQSPQLESHAGSTYCCLAALSMLGALDAENRDDTIHWLVSRQINSRAPEHGGFNGRVNKPADTCYSFWVGGALDILDVLNYTSAELNRSYLLTRTQHLQLGGFGKSENSYPDPLHSCLGLASLALHGESSLLPFDAALCITKRAKDRLKDSPWR